MKRISFLSLLLTFSLILFWGCSDSTGSSETKETPKVPTGQWVFEKDSISTVFDYTIQSFGMIAVDSSYTDTQVESATDTTEIFVTTEDSITVYVKTDTATFVTSYDNSLAFGEGILEGVTVSGINASADSVAQAIVTTLVPNATNVKTEVSAVEVGDPSLKSDDSSLQIIYTVKSSVKITADVKDIPTTLESKVTSTNYATYQKYTGEVPPTDWPQTKIKVD